MASRQIVDVRAGGDVMEQQANDQEAGEEVTIHVAATTAIPSPDHPAHHLTCASLSGLYICAWSLRLLP